MGKKKSKVGKQKQAKAKAKTQKRRENAKFNIPMSQDGVIGQNKQTKKDSKAMPKTLQKKLRGSTKTASNVPHKRNADQTEFDQEYQSLQERQYQAQLSRGKSKMQTIDLAPASLQLNQKPTAEQLVTDAANHLESMNQLGQASMLNSQATGGNTTNLLQVLAAQKRQENVMAQQEATKPRDVGEGNNFWALQESDSDEDAPKHVAPAFNFAAPSFAIPSTSHAGFDVLVDDPDL